jgi:Holliday junction DNA helicase RuvB
VGRPQKNFEGFIGQRDVIRSLERILAGAQRTRIPLPHLLLVGPPGYGKSSLASAIAKACSTSLLEIPSTAVTPHGVAEVLVQMRGRDVVFLDEGHTLKERVVMTLNRALDTGRVPDPDSKGGTETREIPEFTLVIATNRPGELNKPFRSRFVELQLQDYTQSELVEIAKRVAEAQGIALTAQAARRLAEHTDSPRVIGKWTKLIATCYSGAAEVNQPLVEAFLREVVGLDEHGLSARHRRYIQALARHGGRPKAQRTLVVDVGCDHATVAYEIEPDLIRRGLLEINDRGRVLTADGEAVARSISAGAR